MRFTPVSAGNIKCPRQHFDNRRVHPRIRGEYAVTVSSSAVVTGSPPHPRGIYTAFSSLLIRSGFTPASAGNISLPAFSPSNPRVHPRIRGEYIIKRMPDGFVTGSPPHPRGIFFWIFRWLCASRFTPASAGNMQNRIHLQAPIKVHPRIRGEYPQTMFGKIGPAGSPPHPRGILLENVLELVGR